MDDGRRRHHEELLLGEREMALEALHRIEEEEAEPQGASGGDAVRFHDTLAEAASSTQEEESDFLSATRLSDRLTRIDDALRLLRETPDRFGVCRACGEAIEPQRLEIVPWATLCSACARDAEGAATPGVK